MSRTAHRSIWLPAIVVLAATLLFMSVMPGLAGAKKRAAKTPSLVDVAIAVNTEGPYAGAFDTLIAAVLAADPIVVKTLSSMGQYTVFARVVLHQQRRRPARASHRCPQDHAGPAGMRRR